MVTEYGMALQKLGADEVLNYREQDFAEVYKDPSKHFDAIVDLIGGEASGSRARTSNVALRFACVCNSC